MSDKVLKSAPESESFFSQLKFYRSLRCLSNRKRIFLSFTNFTNLTTDIVDITYVMVGLIVVKLAPLH